MRRVAIAVSVSVAVAGCDDRQAWQTPDPTLARMLEQRRADPYEASSAFPDGKVMRTPPRGSVPTDDDRDAPPPPITRELVSLGKQRFDSTCAVCHGVKADGDSVVATKMTLRPPPSLLASDNLARSREELFVYATSGYGLMPGYADMLTREERWAVTAYVQALQLSQRARVADLPPELRDRLAREAR
ncbi:MAG: cytochrome c [Labilithrix sp.]|nr:cytochrome c [Labilithrix sp.]